MWVCVRMYDVERKKIRKGREREKEREREREKKKKRERERVYVLERRERCAAVLVCV